MWASVANSSVFQTISFDHSSLTRLEILILLFDYCCDCIKSNKMSTVGQGVFAARKIRQREMLIAKMNNHEQRFSPQQYTESKLMELTPLKYNSKLMNSIWGLYNRYSVHNFKQNTDAKDRMFGNISGIESQQQRDAVGTLNTDTKTIFDKAFSTVTPTLWNSS